MDNNIQNIAKEFIKSFAKVDELAMRNLLDENIVAYVTNKEGGVDEVQGSNEFLKRLALMDVKNANLMIDITQIVSVSSNQVMFMVEISATMSEKVLNNFAAFLLTIENNKITKYWMVEALPQYSDEFWLGKDK